MEISFDETDRRTTEDRRKKQTSILSWHIFFGRRERFRRKSDQEKGGYVDRYDSKLFLFLVLILGLNILDILLTMIILDHQGWEFNPVVRSVMNLQGDRFWIWKFAIVSTSLAILCLHSKFGVIKEVIMGLSFIYLVIILYQISILIHL
jgi:hypothetical protein